MSSVVQNNVVSRHNFHFFIFWMYMYHVKIILVLLGAKIAKKEALYGMINMVVCVLSFPRIDDVTVYIYT